jgi:hypothetical protein
MISLIKQTSLGPERLKDESTRAYEAFGIYRDLGAARSLDKAWKHFCTEQGKDTAPARRPGHWAKWSQKFRWVERTEAHDDLIDEERRYADAARRQEVQQSRAKFAVEDQQRKEDLVRVFDATLIRECTASRAEVTQVKSIDGTKSKTKLPSPNLLGVAAVTCQRIKLANQAIQGIDTNDLEKEERQIDRVVWAKAPQLPIQGSESGQAKVQPIAGVVPHPADPEPDEPPFQEDKAA